MNLGRQDAADIRSEDRGGIRRGSSCILQAMTLQHT